MLPLQNVSPEFKESLNWFLSKNFCDYWVPNFWAFKDLEYEFWNLWVLKQSALIKINQKEYLERGRNAGDHYHTCFEFENLCVDEDALDVVIDERLYITHERVNLLITLTKLCLASYFPNFDKVHQKIENGRDLIFVLYKFPDLYLFWKNGLLINIVTSQKSVGDIAQADGRNLKVFACREKASVANRNEVSIRSLAQLIKIFLWQVIDIDSDEVIIVVNIFQSAKPFINWYSFNPFKAIFGIPIVPVEERYGLEQDRLIVHL